MATNSRYIDKLVTLNLQLLFLIGYSSRSCEVLIFSDSGKICLYLSFPQYVSIVVIQQPIF